MSDNQNPYTAALNAYGAAAKIEGGRDLEGRILLKSAAMLEELKKRLEKGEKVTAQETGDVLEFNQKLWQFFVNAMKNDEHPLPIEIKNNIATLGLFMFKRTLEVMIDTKPEKLQAMVEINRNIAAGLLNKPKSAEAKPALPGAAPAAKAPPPKAAGPYGKQAAKQPDKPAEQTKTDSIV